MKRFIIVPFISFFSFANSQTTQIPVKEGVFLNVVDWYIESTTDSINSRTEKKINSLDQLGIVAIEFYNGKDSIEEKKSKFTGANEIIRHPRCQFKIFMAPKFSVADIPPSNYFVHKGVFVVIYTGIEPFILFNKKNVHEFENTIRSRRENLIIQGTKEYLIKIDESYPNGFLIIDLKGSP